MARSVKEEAAYRQGLSVEQIKYWHELTPEQQAEADYGILPPRENYVYCVRRDGHLVWGCRFRIVELERGW